MGRVDPAGVQRPRIRSFDLPLQIPSSRAGRSRSSDQTDLRDTRPLRLPARPCSFAPRGMGDQFEEDPSHLQRIGPAAAQQDAEEESEGEAARDRRAASTSNEIWAMDFVHDQLATGQRIRVLTVVDTFSRFSPVIDPRFSYRAEDVVTALEGACASTGYPKTIRVDQGSEFISRGPRSLGLREGRHAGLLTARQTHRQCLHRGIQRPPARRVPERALVSDPCRRPGKSWRIGASTTTRINRTEPSATSPRFPS